PFPPPTLPRTGGGGAGEGAAGRPPGPQGQARGEPGQSPGGGGGPRQGVHPEAGAGGGHPGGGGRARPPAGGGPAGPGPAHAPRPSLTTAGMRETAQRATGRAMTVEIRLLGQFEVRVDDLAAPPSAWTRRQAAALVKLLALTPGRSLHREQLI